MYICICFRLLGPAAAQDVLQLTNTMSGTGQARFHFITNENMRLLNADDEIYYDDFYTVRRKELMF